MSGDLIRIIFHQGKKIRELEVELTAKNKEITSLKELNKKDFLTQALNRKSIFEILKEKLRKSNKYQGVCIAMIDIDHFKSINDTYGHQTGDKVLREVTERMKNVLREHDEVGRYGGEEFLLVLPDCDKAPHGAMERLLKVINGKPIKITEDKKITVTISIGYTFSSTKKQGRSKLIKKADEALYIAKENGRNRAEYKV